MIRPSRSPTVRPARRAMAASWVTTTSVGAVAGVDLFEEIEDAGRGHRVEVAGGLVGQEEGGAVGQAPGDGHPLPLAGREFARPVPGPVRKAHAGQQVAGPRPAAAEAPDDPHHRHLDVLQAPSAAAAG